MTKKPLMKVGVIAALLALVAALFVMSGCGQKTDNTGADAEGSYTLIEEGKLTMASDLAFPPFEYMENNEPAGFSVELMDAVCAEMGLEPNWLPPQKFDTIIPLVSQGSKIDAGVSSFTITDERKQEVDFTEPYLDSNQGLAVTNESPYLSETDIREGGALRIGVQSGTSGEAWALENLPDAIIVPLDDPIAAFSALQAGKVDVVACDLPVQRWLVKNSYTDCQVVAEIPTGEQYGIAVSKDNPALTAELNKALETIKSNGTYDELMEKYFGSN